MNVLQLAPHDSKGGACRIARYLFEGYRRRGVGSYMAVGQKSLDDPDIVKISQDRYRRLSLLAKAHKWVEVMRGHEYFGYPATRHVPGLSPARPDIIHAHNLQGRFFDLRELPWLSLQYPMVLTLHDTWLLGGHCAYSVGCERWRHGCGQCPDLTLGPALQRDGTAYNWARKKRIYAHSRVHVATPSRWLLDQVEDSMLMPGVIDARVIHNGVDLDVFKPANRARVRQELGIPGGAFVLTYVVASRMRSHPYKDYHTVARALDALEARFRGPDPVVFLGLGGEGETERRGNLTRRFISYQTDMAEVAKVYQAADVQIHAARADTFPNVILESLACGTPVVATAVGGIPEQVRDRETGELVAKGDYEAMAARILGLLSDPDRRSAMSVRAAADARARFSLERMIDDYLSLYSEVIEGVSLSAEPSA